MACSLSPANCSTPGDSFYIESYRVFVNPDQTLTVQIIFNEDLSAANGYFTNSDIDLTLGSLRPSVDYDLS